MEVYPHILANGAAIPVFLMRVGFCSLEPRQQGRSWAFGRMEGVVRASLGLSFQKCAKFFSWGLTSEFQT